MMQLTFKVKANTPQPDHEILLVKHGTRDDNEIAFDTQTIVNVNETTVSFMNDENDTEEVDGSFWNHDVELTLYFADGGSATKTVRFVQL